MPKSGDGKCLYLMTSNAEEEYMADGFECLGLPRGFVVHFRYRLQWVDMALTGLLDHEGRKLGASLRKLPVVVSYLCQRWSSEGGWNWERVYPLRLGRLVSAFKSGDDEEDIAHFYFELGDFVGGNESGSEHDELPGFGKPLAAARGSGKYAFLGEQSSDDNTSLKSDESAFRQLAEAIRPEHLILAKETDLGSRVVPLFCFIEGIRQAKGRHRPVLKPRFDGATLRAYYELAEGTRYALDVCFHVPVSLRGSKGELLLEEKGDALSIACANPIPVESRYDKDSWLVIPKLLEREMWSHMVVSSRVLIAGADGASTKALVLRFHAPIKITPRRARRVLVQLVDVVGGVAFAAATALVALSDTAVVPDRWPFLAVALYIAWMLTKLVLVFLHV